MDNLIKSRGFDVELAVKFGLNNAIFLQDLAFWIEFNRNRQKAYRDGRYWTYSTLEELVHRHPYWTKNQIRHIIDVCKKNGWILIEHYDKVSYNQRNWYSICDSVMDCLACKTNVKESHNDVQKTTHQSEIIHTSYNEEDSSMNSDNKNYIPPTPQGERKPRRKKCDVPTLDDVIEYAASRGRKDLAQGFFEYYNEGNWCDSKGSPVLNWKQKFITWEQRNPKPKENTSGGEKIYF